jgi:hypothetical protein
VYLKDKNKYYFYRQNPDSITRKISNELLVKKLEDVTTVFFEIEKFLGSCNILDRYYKEVSIVRDWHLSENIMLIEDISKVELRQSNAQLQESVVELRQSNAQLQESVAELQRQLKNIVESKTYKVGRLVAYPYIKVKEILKTR